MRKIVFITPLSKVDEGIKLCLQNARQYVEEAELLFKQNRLNHSIGLLVLAAEEAGKAKMLLMRREAAKKISKRMNYVQFKPNKGPNPFYDHQAKMKAISLEIAMDEVFAWLRGHEKAPASDYVMTFINASTKLREAVFYVDYDMKNKDWTWITKVDRKKLSHLVNDIKKAIRGLEENL